MVGKMAVMMAETLVVPTAEKKDSECRERLEVWVMV
jgi:hypothetical protein